MDTSPIRISDVTVRYTSTGKVSSYCVECFHDGLKEHREVKSSDTGVLTNKVQALVDRWEEKWQKTLHQNSKVESASAAEAATAEAQRALAECEQLLAHTLAKDDRVDWGKLKIHKPFSWAHGSVPGIQYKPKSGEPIAAKVIQIPDAPERTDAKYKPRFGLLDHLLGFMKRGKLEAMDLLFANDIQAHSITRTKAVETNSQRETALRCERLAFEAAREAYDAQVAAISAKVDELHNAWSKKSADAVMEHAELVLNASEYPDWLNPDFAIGYFADSGMMIVDYQLPPPDGIPTLERVTFVKSRNETTEKHLTDAKAQKLFDTICYQIALRTIHELFEADEPNAIQAVTFNGWVEATNKATGRTERACILSVQALKEEFLAFDLAKIDPKACFKLLKGVAASSLAQLAPVRPVIQLDRDDTRFVDSYDVASKLDESTNLAAMSWEDFEHLVRELFGKVFSGPGAEVKVTQASRDGGVDAIALDPDPIKGGKIVIQAKRYTGTVGVSAVRDLYGTVLNEGANRGILVTTSNFGPDAYKFAAGKPITLLNGSNLLSLLSDHGHKAKIDLAEAKRLLQNA